MTPAQAAYTRAFLEWFRSGSSLDYARRENAFEVMMSENAA